MASWNQIEHECADFAAAVRARFGSGTNKTIATLRKDGSPRISGIELSFEPGRITVGMMAGSLKLADVRRDPRVAVHSPTLEPPVGQPAAWVGEAKLAGRLVATEAPRDTPFPDAGFFVLDVTEAVHVRVDPTASFLLIESWNPQRGYRIIERA
ncbi:pyridoxamine 5'-phosphate oxidase family protein [Jatrophihabitans telluris]|uniref:Pyridoxamine 5'-phosphate oxidase family protein n=1 Tax=Jatrophihabitans telluris TaxID=2038343 RepID=A0ABY4R1Y9_9ACTN|nr:pyridoxamine 5'-phosphate oxidase family protein [Jatrophihabitans telluris]UQX89936.1 pyridoxamine 5'-phosphate oxidase family protein [Jatrophihabitans telluris]